MKKYVRDVLDFAQANGLNLSARLETLLVSEIETVESVDPDVVSKIARLFTSSVWPSRLPLIVVASNIGEGYAHDGYMLLDGHHRLAAAESAGAVEIPTLVVSLKAYDEIANEYDIPRVDYIQDVLAAVDPLISENLKKGVGGRPKRRL